MEDVQPENESTEDEDFEGATQALTQKDAMQKWCQTGYSRSKSMTFKYIYNIHLFYQFYSEFRIALNHKYPLYKCKW